MKKTSSKSKSRKKTRHRPRKLYAIIMRESYANGTTYSPWEAQAAASIPSRVVQGAIIVDYRKLNRLCKAGKYKSYYEVAKLAAVDIEAEIEKCSSEEVLA